MTHRIVRNIAASVYARLQNKAKEANRRFDEWLAYFAMERFLYRLIRTGYAKHFVLKGALMLKAWKVATMRPTMDIDLLGRPGVVEQIHAIVRDACTQSVEPDDGLIFDPESVRTGPIAKREGADFMGVRASFQATLLTARIPMQIDVGFGTVFPAPVPIDLPSILDFPPPRMMGYTRESSIAEKFHAMAKRELLNSRMKDFFDIWVLSRHFEFDGDVLSQAIAETFTHRGMKVPSEPVALTTAFSDHPQKNMQWQAFLRKQRLKSQAPESLRVVVDHVTIFLGPVIRAMALNAPGPVKWLPGGPWQAR